MTAGTTGEDYAQAASRHLRDAEHLARDNRLDSAAHLLGFATECAIKSAVRELRPGQNVPHKHIPELIEEAKKCLKGRAHQPLLSLLRQPGYFANWSVGLRYAPDHSVTPQTYAEWQRHAKRTFGTVGLKGIP